MDSVDYLVKAASLLPSQNHFQKLLRSYYLTKCKKLAQTDEKHGNTLFSEEEMCRKCSTPWFDINFSMSIAPIKTTKRKASKIHTELQDKSSHKIHLAKKLSRKINNVVTVKCDLCESKNRIILRKKSPAELKQQKAERNEKKIMNNKQWNQTTLDAPSQSSTKKKRNKDKSAGLLYTVNKDDNSVKKTAQIKQKPQISNVQKKPKKQLVPFEHWTQCYRPGHQNPNNKGNLQNERNTKHKQIHTKNTKNMPPPVVKRNCLLQLANALKAKSNPSGSSTQADKLKHLLK